VYAIRRVIREPPPRQWLVALAAWVGVFVLTTLLLGLVGGWAMLLLPAVIAAAASVRTAWLPTRVSVLARWAATAGAFLPTYYVLTIPLVERAGSLARWPWGTFRQYELYSTPYYKLVYFHSDDSWKAFNYWHEWCGLATNTFTSWTMTILLPLLICGVLGWLLHRRFQYISAERST
jgi:hypothetical protein